LQSFATTQNQVQAAPKTFLQSPKPSSSSSSSSFFFLSLGYSTACCNEGNFFGRFSFLGISFHFLGGKKKKTSSSFFNHTREGTQLSFLLGGKEKEKKKIFG
jgi:hypothetical protein